MDWKFTGDRPVYQQIMDKIRCAVISGEFSPGGKVPAVRDLAAEARVNPNTMQRALHELESEGLLIADSTAGRYVTEDPGVLEAVRQQQLNRVCRECMQQFDALGVPRPQAAELLAGFFQREE